MTSIFRGDLLIWNSAPEELSVKAMKTKGTFDAYSYQTLENKQKFISQIMTSKTPARKGEYTYRTISGFN